LFILFFMVRSRMLWRLFGTYGFLLLVAIGLLGMVIVGRVEKYFLSQTEDGLRTKAILLREVVRHLPAGDSITLQERASAWRQEIAARITLLAHDGRVLADSHEDASQMENHADRPEVVAARDQGFGTSTRRSSTLGEPMMYAALPTGDDRGPAAYVRVAVPLDRVHEQLAVLRGLVWTAALATGLIALGLAFWLARRISLPLRELTSGAERIAAGNYGQKVYAAATDEIGHLARAFNHMSESLATQFAQLAKDRQQLRIILGAMVEGVVALDADQRVLFANERAGQLLGFQPESTAGRKLWEVTRRRALQDVVKRALARPEPLQEELNWDNPATRSLMVHAAPLSGSPRPGALLVLHDTSELRRLERVRQEFVANVSHELKTPLSVIKACVETLLGGAIDDAEHRGPFLAKIGEQSDRLHALILDLLSLARIESETEVFAFAAVQVRPLVEACVARQSAKAQAKNQRLEAAPSSVEADSTTAWADEEAVSEILENLIDNAIKYTPEGGSIFVRWRPEADQVCIEVEDTGIGIPPQDLPRIFERFYRVDKARSRELGGTGLGLSIVKHLVQAMHGSVRATSQPGKGSTFTVLLPRASH
jgi:two-component system phosphate regulon sensor histidine kinase PhoR